MNTYTFTLPEDIKATAVAPRTVEEYNNMEKTYAIFHKNTINLTPDKEAEELIEHINPNRAKCAFGTNHALSRAIHRWFKRTFSKHFRGLTNTFRWYDVSIFILNPDDVRQHIIIRDDCEVIPAGTEIVSNVDIATIIKDAAREAKRAATAAARYECERIDEAVDALVIE